MYITWLIGYLVIIIGVGYYFSKKVNNADDYTVASSSLGFFPICGTIMATATGSFAIIATSGRGFTTGLSFLTWNIGYVLFGILAAILLASAIRALKLYTIPELFKRRFGRWAALLPALTIGLMFLIPLFAVQLVGMGSVMASTIGIDFEFGVLIGFIVCVGFTLAGGMFSVAWTDSLQMVIILFGVVLLFFLSAGQLGGVTEAFRNSTPKIVDPFSITFGDWLSLLLIFGTLSFVYQTTWQRIAAAKSKRIAVRAVSTGFGIVFIMTILTVCIGIFARQLIPIDTKPDMVYSTLMTKVMPSKIAGLFVVTLFSAILTSATSFLLSGATSIARDIYTE
jgi:SSS family solute:Na+ symporter